MFIYPTFYHNGRNISTIYIYNKTSIKINILTIKIHREIGRAKNLSAPRYKYYQFYYILILEKGEARDSKSGLLSGTQRLDSELLSPFSE
jgi:hypothetical protein